MRGGGRRTHDFPYGKPFFLTFIETAFGISFIVSAVYFGFHDWRSAAPTLALLLAYALTYSFLIRRYERTGQAVRRKRIKVKVSFPEGLPKPLIAARLAFFAVAGLMLMFGIGPFRFAVAKIGIIGSVFGLFGVAAANLLVERHYVKVGRAIEIKFAVKPDK
jgi:hypothetical protein